MKLHLHTPGNIPTTFNVPNMHVIETNVSKTVGNHLVTRSLGTKNGESTMSTTMTNNLNTQSTTITNNNVDIKRKAVITSDRDKSSNESTTIGDHNTKHHKEKWTNLHVNYHSI